MKKKPATKTEDTVNIDLNFGEMPEPDESKAGFIISHCNFQGSDSAGVLALARALEANARAIEALCGSVSSPRALLNIVGGEKVD